MSRVGKKLILIPKDVKITLKQNEIHVKGIYGKLVKNYLPFIKIEKNKDYLSINRTLDTKEAKSYHGFIRMYIQNMILGVMNVYIKILCLEGIGFKFLKKNNLLILNVGFTHTHKILIPTSLKIDLNSSTKLQISGSNKEEVSLFADIIQKIKYPEPYKGKGILYDGQKILKKIGKRRR